MLGNTLRAAERRAGERYYLPTVETLPRLYQHLSARLGAAYDAAVDTLDAAARMAVSTAAAGLFAAAAYYDDPGLWWIPVGLWVLSFLSYRGAITAAAQYGLFMDIAFDVHRFDLLKALHLDLALAENLIRAGQHATHDDVGAVHSTAGGPTAG